MNPGYSNYSSYHEIIRNCCDCVNANRCSKLRDEVETIKSSVERIDTDSSWDDDAGKLFKSNRNNCLNILNNVCSSIDTVFTKSEEVYDLQLQQLDSLKLLDDSYNTLINSKPDKDDYKKTKTNSNGEKETYYPGYEEALEKWKKDKEKLENKAKEMIDSIENYKSILNAINGCTIDSNGNISNISNINDMTIPDIVHSEGFQTLDMYINKDLMKLVEINGEQWYVIDTGNMSYDDILETHGAQTSNACHTWSVDYYSKDLLEKSGQIYNPDAINKYSSPNAEDIYKIAFEQICQGKPVVFKVNGLSSATQSYNGYKGQNFDTSGFCEVNYDENGNPRYSRHFVAGVAIKASADPNNLKPSDFGIMDPAFAEFTSLDTKREWVNSSGIAKAATRKIIKNEEDAYHYEVGTPGYYIETFNDDGDYTRWDNVDVGSFGVKT